MRKKKRFKETNKTDRLTSDDLNLNLLRVVAFRYSVGSLKKKNKKKRVQLFVASERDIILLNEERVVVVVVVAE